MESASKRQQPPLLHLPPPPSIHEQSVSNSTKLFSHRLGFLRAHRSTSHYPPIPFLFPTHICVHGFPVQQNKTRSSSITRLLLRENGKANHSSAAELSCGRCLSQQCNRYWEPELHSLNKRVCGIFYYHAAFPSCTIS